MEQTPLFNKACELAANHHREKEDNTNKCYEGLSKMIQREILKTATEGKRFLSIDPKKAGITIWDSIPRLLKDSTFEGFKINPKNPDEDDTYITIGWR